jgi:hypothetical protein
MKKRRREKREERREKRKINLKKVEKKGGRIGD